MVGELIRNYISDFGKKCQNGNGMPLDTIAEEIGFELAVTQRLFENVFRARTLKDSPLNLDLLESKYSLVSEFGPTPSGCVEKKGRCNLIKESMGYFSLDTGTPIFEVRPQKGQFIALSQFNNRDQIMLNLGVVGGSFIISKINEDSRYRQSIDDNLYKFLNKQPSFSIEAILNKYDTENNCKKYAFDHLLSFVFTQSNESLEISSSFKRQGSTLYEQTNRIKNFLSRSFADSGTKIKGILYPSIQSEYFGICCCCSSDVFEETFKYDSSIIYEVKNVNNKTLDLQPIFEGKKEGDKIKWISIKEENMLWELRTDSQIKIINIE